jgi:argininosuccinate lyase
MLSFRVTTDSLGILVLVVGALITDREACKRGCSDDIYATERVYKLVREGMVFRDAYRKVAAELFDRED